MTELDLACAEIVAAVRAAHLTGVKLSVRCDGRVWVEAFHDSLLSRSREADVHPEGSPLPKPSEAVPLAIKEARQAAERRPK